ncbi:trichodiene oxygenase [Xylariaceae sp. FL0662B]|nr:trichodiene oxygenase [Xylariaceae sp. FL0662B]
MESLVDRISWRTAASTAAVYLASLSFYRLSLHPIGCFPGPRLAAISRWYEAYYDVDKYPWAYDAFSNYGATVCTADHDTHKARRLSLNSFFSKARVANHQDMIRRNSNAVVNLGAAIGAYTRGISTEYILSKSLGTSGGWPRVTKHFRLFGPTMRSIPTDWTIKVADHNAKAFFHYLAETDQDTKHLFATEILDSSLPPKEKSIERVLDDVYTVTGLASACIDFADTVELNTLEHLPYLTAIRVEGLRLSPAIASRMARIAPDRVIFYKEWRIPAKTPRFYPGCWMDHNARKGAHKTFAPFSGGTRNCLCMHLAWAEMCMVVTTLTYAEDFECDGDRFSITTKGKGFLKASGALYKG